MSTHCDLLVARAATGFIVRVQGRGTSAHSPALVDFVTGCFKQDADACVAVDLLGCEYLDSTFLGSLLSLQRAGTETRFQVVADEVVRQKLLAATHLDAYLNLVPTAPKCSGQFVRIDTKTLSERELGMHIMQAHQVLSELPSDVAASFRQIANQLKSELEEDKDEPCDLTDTVVLRAPTRS